MAKKKSPAYEAGFKAGEAIIREGNLLGRAIQILRDRNLGPLDERPEWWEQGDQWLKDSGFNE